MLKKLENYYRGVDILSTEFNCEHREKCSKGAADFTEAKSAFVGTRYGENGMPRLLFISSDPGGAKILTKDGGIIDFTKPANRTPEGVQRLVIERVRRGIKSPSPRAKSTCELARCILQAFDSSAAKMNEEELTQNFAHVNSVKCCENNPGKAEAKNAALVRNCRRYLRGEIAAFAPDILIAHGKKAEQSVLFAFRKDANKKEVAPNAYELQTSDGEFFWLQTPHPSSFGRKHFLAQKRGEDGGPGWAGYVELMQQFYARKRL